MIASFTPDFAAKPKRRNRKRKYPPGHHKWHVVNDRVREWVFITPDGWVKLRRGLRLRHYHNMSELLEQLAQRWGAEDADQTTPLEQTIIHMVAQGVQKRQQLADELARHPRAEIDAWVDGLIARGLLEEVFERAQTGLAQQKILILPGARTGDGYLERPGESNLAQIAREDG